MTFLSIIAPEPPKEIAELLEMLYALGPFHDDLGKEGRGQIVLSILSFAQALPDTVQLDPIKTRELPMTERWQRKGVLQEKWRHEFEIKCNALLGAESPVRVLISPYCTKGTISIDLVNQC
ncbi:MAG TPA: hypothetical protein PKV97_00100 [Thauera aminoaromatica]|nr:hypothetical protein [Thauera aminoaromatica]